MKNAISLAWFAVKAALFIILYLSVSEVAVVAYQQY